MTAPRRPTEEYIFHEALERPAEERAAFLDEACAGDDELRARIERLLAADADAPQRFLVTDAEVETPALERVHRLGDFEILELLGQGGMGTVYAALQRSPRREVALKVVRAGEHSEETTARFQREIEVLEIGRAHV